MALFQDLHAIRELVATKLLALKEVDSLLVLRHMEVPYLVMNLLTKAVNRLVCSNHQVILWIKHGHQEDCL